MGGLSINSTEVYDYTTGTWSATGNMSISRYQFQAPVLLDGTGEDFEAPRLSQMFFLLLCNAHS